jgi:hypothetical protein
MGTPAMRTQGVSKDLTERMLRRFLLLCENPRTQRRVLALVEASVSNARAGRRFYALVNRLVLSPILRAAGVQTSAVRIELVGAQLVGLAMMRYVLKVEPIASLDVDELVPMMAPALRQTLTGRSQAAPAPEACDCQSPDLTAVPW